MNHRDGKKRVEAYRETFPAHNQSAIFALEPGKRPLGLEAWDSLFVGTPTWLIGGPHLFGNLGVDPASAEALAKIFGVVSSIRRQHFEPFARSAPCTGADMEGVQQREDLGALVPNGSLRSQTSSLSCERAVVGRRVAWGTRRLRTHNGQKWIIQEISSK
jgi:hypothetical protein